MSKPLADLVEGLIDFLKSIHAPVIAEVAAIRERCGESAPTEYECLTQVWMTDEEMRQFVELAREIKQKACELGIAGHLPDKDKLSRELDHGSDPSPVLFKGAVNLPVEHGLGSDWSAYASLFCTWLEQMRDFQAAARAGELPPLKVTLKEICHIEPRIKPKTFYNAKCQGKTPEPAGKRGKEQEFFYCDMATFFQNRLPPEDEARRILEGA